MWENFQYGSDYSLDGFLFCKNQWVMYGKIKELKYEICNKMIRHLTLIQPGSLPAPWFNNLLTSVTITIILRISNINQSVYLLSFYSIAEILIM